jgi:hypothetical protein
MINRRTMSAGMAAGVLTAPWDFAGAMPIGSPAGHTASQWTYAQFLPPVRPPKPPDLADPKAFGQYLAQSADERLKAAGISSDDDAQNEIKVLAERAGEAAFRPQKEGEIKKGAGYDALPVEVRRTIVVRNFNTFVDVNIVVALKEGKKLTKEVINRVQGFLCPLYPVCTG